MPTIIIAALLSITGLLGAFLYIGQSKSTDAAVQAAQAQQQCEKARFDMRFDTALVASSPRAKADAQRVQVDCAKADKLAKQAAATANEQASTLDRLESAISNALKGGNK